MAYDPRSGIRNGHQYGFTPEPKTQEHGYPPPPPPLKTDTNGRQRYSQYSVDSSSQISSPSYTQSPASIYSPAAYSLAENSSDAPSNISSSVNSSQTSFQQDSPAMSERDSMYFTDYSPMSGFRPESRYTPSLMSSSSYYTPATSTPTSFQSFSPAPSSMYAQPSGASSSERSWESHSMISAVEEVDRYVPTPMSSYYSTSSATPLSVNRSSSSRPQSPVSPVTEYAYPLRHCHSNSHSEQYRPNSTGSDYTQTSSTPNPAPSDSTLKRFESRYPESPSSPLDHSRPESASSLASSNISLGNFVSRYPQSPGPTPIHHPHNANVPSPGPSNTTLQQFKARYPESPSSFASDVSSPLVLYQNTPPPLPPKIPISYHPHPHNFHPPDSAPQRASDSSTPLNIIRPTATPNIVQPHPHRPALPPPQFTQPHIATPYEHPQQAPTLATNQFEHPYSRTPQPLSNGLNIPPELPARPISAPLGQHEDWTNNASGLAVKNAPQIQINPEYARAAAVPSHLEDHQSPLVARVVANMMPIRIGRSTAQTIQSTAKLPFYLSPWGDNNPITLPNIRKRDIAMAGVTKFGIDHLAPSAVTLVEHIFQQAAEHVFEEAAEYSVHKIHGRTPDKRLKRRVGINSLTLRIKHKLLGEDAELIFLNQRPTNNKTSCAKGWFNPYLYASGRTPDIPRSKDFSIAQLLSPGLAADASIAPTILSTFAETATPIISPLCPWEVTHPSFPRYRRMAVLLVAISPYRTANAWSQCRIPNEARLCFHIFTHLPAVVVPVRGDAPVLGWGSWTVDQMLRGSDSTAPATPASEKGAGVSSPTGKLKYDPHLAYGDTSFLERERGVSKKGRSFGYDSASHINEIMDFLDRVVDENLMDAEMRSLWRKIVDDGIRSIINGVLDTATGIRATAAGVCDLERAGVVMFRY